MKTVFFVAKTTSPFEEEEMIVPTTTVSKETSKLFSHFELTAATKRSKNIWRMPHEMLRIVRKRFRMRSSRLWELIFCRRSSPKLIRVKCLRSWLTKQLTFPTKKTCLLFFASLTHRQIYGKNSLVFTSGEETTGEAIKDLILKSINDLGLNMDDCRGQSHDGAGNMAGRYVGASTLIQRQFQKVVYVHCMNHRLNLCVADTCSLAVVRNMMGTVRKLSDFFYNLPKRQHHLVERIKELLPTSNHRILIDICRTR